MVRYVFLVALLCLGSIFGLPAEEDKTEGKEKEWTCPQCDEIGAVDCASCFGAGNQILKCIRCEGTGACKSCKGAGYCVCGRCNGKGTIIHTWLVVGTGPDAGRHSEEVACPNCKTQGEIICAKCKGEAVCSECHGAGAVASKKECPTCKGSGRVKCQFCESKGKIKNAQIMSHNDVIDEMHKLSGDLSKSTDLQQDKIKRQFVAKWNNNFAGKIIKWEGKLENVDKLETAERVSKILYVQLRSRDITVRLWIMPKWEEKLLQVSRGATVVFLIIFPRMVLDSDRRLAFINLYPGKWRQLQLSLDEWSRGKIYGYSKWSELTLGIDHLYPGLIPVTLLWD